MNALKRKQVRIYIEEADESVMTSLLNGSPLTETQLVSMICSAGLKAIRANGGRATLPMKFQVADDQEGFEEETEPHPKQKAA